MPRDAEGSLAAFTLLPQPFRATSFPGLTPKLIPHATADPGTLTIHTTITSIGASSEPVAITGTESWSDHGGQSVYTDVRTTGTPRVAGLSAELMMERLGTSNRSVLSMSSGRGLMSSSSWSSPKPKMRMFWGFWVLGVVIQYLFR